MYAFVAAGTLTINVLEGCRVVKVAVTVATGVNTDRSREPLVSSV